MMDFYRKLKTCVILAFGSSLRSILEVSENGLRKCLDMFGITYFTIEGNKIAINCEKVPQTCKLIESIPDAAGCRRGQVSLSRQVHFNEEVGPV